MGRCTSDLTVTLVQVFAENKGDSGRIFLHDLHFVRSIIILEKGRGEIPIFCHWDRMPEGTGEAGLFWLVGSKVLVHGICLCCFRAQHHGKGHMWTTVAHLTVDRRQREGQEGVRDKAVPIVSYFLQISPMSFLVSMPSNRLRL